MSVADKLNVAGILIAGLGSTVAMFGVYMQMNGYFAFKAWKVFGELFRIVKTFLSKGWSEGKRRIALSASLAEDRESRARSLVGFYLVFFGFSLQMLGSGLMLAALIKISVHLATQSPPNIP